MAHFVATYGVRHGIPKRPATDEMQTMLAVFDSRKHRYSMVQAAVLAVQVYLDRALPFLLCDLFHSSCRALDSGAINQDIEAIEFGTLSLEKRRDLRFIGHIGMGCQAGRKALLKCGQGSVIDIANVDFGARFRECGCDGGSNTGCACSYQNPQYPVADRVDPGRSFFFHLSLSFFATTVYRPWQSGEMDILRAFQLQDLPDFRGCGDFKGEFFKNAADLPDLFGVTLRLDAGAEIEIVFQPHAHIRAQDGAHGQKGHLVASCAQASKADTESRPNKRSAVDRMTKRFSGSGPMPAEDSENCLNKERRLDDAAIDEVGEIVKVADVVALQLESSAALSKIAKNVFNVREGILEDAVSSCPRSSASPSHNAIL